jgi:predicted GTPase
MRSIQVWLDKIKSTNDKIIICITKCDVNNEESAEKDDFQLRKAKIMEHFLRQYQIEYISAKTNANVGFIYKYL